MNRRILTGFVVAILVGSTCTAVVLAQTEHYVRGKPDLDVYVDTPERRPGTATEVTLQIANDGTVFMGSAPQRDIVTTARGVTVEVADEGPFEVDTRTQAIGSIADGSVREVPVTLTVPDDVEPGEYTIDVQLEYSYTSEYDPVASDVAGSVTERSRTTTREVDIVVDDGPRFDLRTVEGVQIGSTSSVKTEITNIGEETARGITLDIESDTTDVLLGNGTRTTGRIDRLDPGESATVPFDVTVREDISLHDFTLTGSVAFRDSDGVWDTQTGLSSGLDVEQSQEFSIAVEDSNLRVGELGTVHGTVTNEGPSPVEHVVVSLAGDAFDVRTPAYAVGSLDSGESAPFLFRGKIPSGSDAVPQRLDVTTAYRNTDGRDRARTSPVRVAVGSRRDVIGVRATSNTVYGGENGTLTLELTNRHNTTITEIRPRLLADSPLMSPPQTAALDPLEANESGRVTFEIAVAPNARANVYPATLETTYEDADGIERTTTTPVRVNVQNQGDAIDVEPTTATFEAGESNTLDVNLTNRRSRSISDVRVQLAVADPLASDFRSSAISGLNANETGEVTFDLEVDSDAPASQYPATLRIQYTDADGDEARAGTSTITVVVVSPRTTIPFVEIGVVVLVLMFVAGGGWWFYGREFIQR